MQRRPNAKFILAGLLSTATWLIALLCTSCSKPEKKTEQEQANVEAKAILKNPTAPAPSAPLRPNEEVFDFTALAHNGQRLKLSEFLHKPVFIYFCEPGAAGACRDIALSLRDGWLSLNEELSMVFGVSPADTVVHREFSSQAKLPFLLLADTESSVRRVFGLKPGMVSGYLIGTNRKILHVFQPIVAQTLVADLLRAARQPAPPAPVSTGSSSSPAHSAP